MMYLFCTEEIPATESIQTSDEEKDPQNESNETNNTETEGNAKEEAPPALIETSSEPPRGLGSFVISCLPQIY